MDTVVNTSFDPLLENVNSQERKCCSIFYSDQFFIYEVKCSIPVHE